MTEGEKAAITAKVWAAVASRAAVEGTSIELGDNLRQALGLDDFDILDLALDLEETFSIELPDETLAGVNTFSDLVEHVLKVIG